MNFIAPLASVQAAVGGAADAKGGYGALFRKPAGAESGQRIFQPQPARARRIRPA